MFEQVPLCGGRGGLSEALADDAAVRAFMKDSVMCLSMVVNSSVFTSTGAEVCKVGTTWVNIADVVALAGVPCSVN